MSSGAKQVLRLVRDVGGLPLAWLRARRIVHAYGAHYRRAREVPPFPGVTPRFRSLRDVRVQVLQPGDGVRGQRVTDPSLIKRLGDEVETALERTGNCLMFPKPGSEAMPERTRDVPAIAEGRVIALQLKDPLGLDGLEELSARLVPELERSVYGAPLIVDKVYVYRSLPSCLEGQVSWAWHYDNHPHEILKVMVYLTDVADTNGPFEYLRRRRDGAAVLMRARPLCGYSRITAAEVARRITGEDESHRVMGPSGTVILFDNNVLHRANVPSVGCRDVVVLQVRPAHFVPRAPIDRAWTGSFPHVDFNPDPYDYQPRPKLRMLSG